MGGKLLNYVELCGQRNIKISADGLVTLRMLMYFHSLFTMLSMAGTDTQRMSAGRIFRLATSVIATGEFKKESHASKK